MNLLRPYPQFDGEFDGFPLSARTPATTPCSSALKSEAANISPSKAAIRSPVPPTTVPPATTAGWAGTALEVRKLWTSCKNETSLSANNATHRAGGGIHGEIPVGRGLLIGNNMNRVARCGDRRLVGFIEPDPAERAACGHPDGHQSSGGRSQRPNVTLFRIPARESAITHCGGSAAQRRFQRHSACSIPIALPIPATSSWATLPAISTICFRRESTMSISPCGSSSRSGKA